MAAKPVVGVLCCNEVVDRPVQVVATRFVAPLVRYAEVLVVLVPAVAEASDAAALSAHLDGLLLTGSRSHVAADRYAAPAHGGLIDAERDEVALALAGRMIEAGKPVFGICRGMQELNVLFGGSLSRAPCGERHLRGTWAETGYANLFDHRHDVLLAEAGQLAAATHDRRVTVTSVHEQAIDRLGGGLAVEARSVGDEVIEAVVAASVDAAVLGVQWHPEWDVATSATSQAFFRLLGDAARGGGARRRAPLLRPIPPDATQRPRPLTRAIR